VASIIYTASQSFHRVLRNATSPVGSTRPCKGRIAIIPISWIAGSVYHIFDYGFCLFPWFRSSSGKCGEQGDDKKKLKSSIDRRRTSLYIGEGNLRAAHDCAGTGFGMCMLRHGSHMYITPSHIYAPNSTFTMPDMLSESTFQAIFRFLGQLSSRYLHIQRLNRHIFNRK
jgi:hypothetical protein